MSWSKRDRLAAIAAGEPADRPPVAAWHHFIREETDVSAFVDATVAFQKAYDWDVVKINPRAVYFTETWGNEYDYSYYIGYGPKCVHSVLERPEQLFAIEEKDITVKTLADQLEVVRLLRERLGPETPIIQTVYSPLAIILNLTGTRLIGRYREAPREESPIVGFMRENKEGLHHALMAISATMANYVEALLRAGADGIFFASLGLAREGYLTYEEWETFSRRYDLISLEPGKTAFNVLHTCGIYSNPERFADYPIKVLHWAENALGNPRMEEAGAWIGKMGIMGGVDERLFGTGQHEKIGQAAAESCDKMKGRPFFLAPECSVSPDSSNEDLTVLRNAADEVHI